MGIPTLGPRWNGNGKWMKLKTDYIFLPQSKRRIVLVKKWKKVHFLVKELRVKANKKKYIIKYFKKNQNKASILPHTTYHIRKHYVIQ